MINVGICGLGFMGMIHYLAYQKVRGAKVKAICEKIPERLAGDWRSIKGNFGPRGKKMNLAGIATYSELDKMLADPNIDMVDICLPPFAHAENAIAALKAGKHVLCEKPIALSVDDARRMVKTASQTGKMLMIAHVLPFFAAYRFALNTIQSKKYGRFLGGNFTRVISDPLWLKDFYDPNGCGGPMVDLHIHDAHFIRLICGMPKAVHSVGRMRGQVAEYFNTQFLCSDPSLVVTATSGVINQQGRPFTNGYEIHLERATLLFESWTQTPVTVLTDDGRVRRPKFTPGTDETDDFAAELTEATKAIATGKPSKLLDGQLALDALILGQRQTESIVKRRPIKV
ncbi:MAG: Gfo/Idh/MocA family protein [Thermoguttaceae bacterium]|jgi:predicted dehydrogenase